MVETKRHGVLMLSCVCTVETERFDLSGAKHASGAETGHYIAGGGIVTIALMRILRNESLLWNTICKCSYFCFRARWAVCRQFMLVRCNCRVYKHFSFVMV